jgi:hypothetical protein
MHVPWTLGTENGGARIGLVVKNRGKIKAFYNDN